MVRNGNSIVKKDTLGQIRKVGIGRSDLIREGLLYTYIKWGLKSLQ